MGQWLSLLDLTTDIAEGKASDIPYLYNVDLSEIKQMERSEKEFNVYVVYPAKFEHLVQEQIVPEITKKLAKLGIRPTFASETFEHPTRTPLQKACHFVILFHPLSAWIEWNGQILSRLRTALCEGRLQCDYARLTLYESYLSFV
jgi:hypothetical protein